MSRSFLVRGVARTSRALILTVVVATVLVFCAAAQASATTFDPAKIISDDNMRAYDCLTQADIQAFLATQKGPLKTLSVPRHDKGTTTTASTIISEACTAWHISPKVMLTMLQKEQSLLTRTSLVTGSKGTLDWAVGMGCPDGSARVETYRGFGNQIWYAAQRLDGYGEAGKSTVPVWHSGLGYSVNTVGSAKTNLVAANIATYKLYVYNPCIGVASKYYGDLSKASGLSGNSNFWAIYHRYFGDTFANPAIRPVYRFHDTKIGGYLYTASPAERYKLTANRRYKYEVVAFSWNTTNTANSIPMYRFMNRKTGAYQFTTSQAKCNSLRSAAHSKAWRYQGVAFKVSNQPASAVLVYRFDNKKTGLPFLTKSTAEKKKFLTSKFRKTWKYKGVSFYLAR